MACKSCVERQRKLVKLLCKFPDSKLCKRAVRRLELMTQQPEKKSG